MHDKELWLEVLRHIEGAAIKIGNHNYISEECLLASLFIPTSRQKDSSYP